MDKYIGAKLIQAEPERNPVTKEITGIRLSIQMGTNLGLQRTFSKKHI